MRLKNYLDKEPLRKRGYFIEISNCVAKHMGVNKNKIKASSGRKREYVQARNMTCSILNSGEHFRLGDIANLVGYLNHTSVIHAIKMHEIDMGFDKRYVSMYLTICANKDGANEYGKTHYVKINDFKPDSSKAKKEDDLPF